MKIVLIGYRGCGKTTVARRLSLRLGWPWVDADVEIELRAGKSIAAIFADEGEPAFRDLEAQVVAELAGRDRIVLAAGGGAVMRAENRDHLRRNAHVVWLKADPETVHQRMTQDEWTRSRRPALTAHDAEAEIRELLSQREPLYRATADFELETANTSPDEIADEILRRLNLGPTLPAEHE